VKIDFGGVDDGAAGRSGVPAGVWARKASAEARHTKRVET
jgi:hypothetical protein